MRAPLVGVLFLLATLRVATATAVHTVDSASTASLHLSVDSPYLSTDASASRSRDATPTQNDLLHGVLALTGVSSLPPAGLQPLDITTDMLKRPLASTVVLGSGWTDEEARLLVGSTASPSSTQMTALAAANDKNSYNLYSSDRAECEATHLVISGRQEGALDGAIQLTLSQPSFRWSISRRMPAASDLSLAAALASDVCSPVARGLLELLPGVSFSTSHSSSDCTYLLQPADASSEPVELRTTDHATHHALAEAALLSALADQTFSAVSIAGHANCPLVYQLESHSLSSVTALHGVDSALRIACGHLLLSATQKLVLSTQSAAPGRTLLSVFSEFTQAPRPASSSKPRKLSDAIPTIEEISDFQILLWTSIGLIGALLVIVYYMLYMDVGRDPALYSQFGRDADIKLE